MSALERIEYTRAALGDALAVKDWAAIGKLDLQCRACLDGLFDGVAVDPAVLRHNLEALLNLYRQLVEASRGERQAVAEELKQVRQGQSASKVYQLFR
ncbi:flagellar protein FliT [Pseudomonas sp. RIT-PI-S]|uniref:flagellar protein FliT n=1 Tax=Pseudomonas sp. RIT-PI-S TaxID=3035295 RepID=UPI0021DB40F5|nr:flagellar protein FliT [Pseudomonas sp. RIT-PI-S]